MSPHTKLTHIQQGVEDLSSTDRGSQRYPTQPRNFSTERQQNRNIRKCPQERLPIPPTQLKVLLITGLIHS
ncbi:hypothetical protein E2C01_046707 [Portunus trituberculatus]|uniref:Uncharacterized protein n=1 Tax=Portunus trituberculatus TaxID=210409 RepID=A0A5B7G6W4_PORTR|nr:hypothetical protein [Portunus trituberculatus]